MHRVLRRKEYADFLLGKTIWTALWEVNSTGKWRRVCCALQPWRGILFSMKVNVICWHSHFRRQAICENDKWQLSFGNPLNSYSDKGI
jgi:hypothetical protein